MIFVLSVLFLNYVFGSESQLELLDLGGCEISIYHSFDPGHSVDGKRYSYYLDWGVIRSEKIDVNKNLADQPNEDEYYRGFKYKKYQKNVKGKETEVIVIDINDWKYYLIGDATTYLDDLIDSCSS